jgi:hypothetical protein
LIHHHRKEGNLDEFVPILSTGKIFLQLGKEEEEREENQERKNRNTTHRNAFQEL